MTARIFTLPFEDTLKGLLWGYPSLFDEFHEKVKPELDAARRRKDTEPKIDKPTCNDRISDWDNDPPTPEIC